MAQNDVNRIVDALLERGLSDLNVRRQATSFLIDLNNASHGRDGSLVLKALLHEETFDKLMHALVLLPSC